MNALARKTLRRWLIRASITYVERGRYSATAELSRTPGKRGRFLLRTKSLPPHSPLIFRIASISATFWEAKHANAILSSLVCRSLRPGPGLETAGCIRDISPENWLVLLGSMPNLLLAGFKLRASVLRIPFFQVELDHNLSNGEKDEGSCVARDFAWRSSRCACS